MCGYLGSGPLGLALALVGVLVGFGALGMLVGTRAEGDPLLPLLSVSLGVLAVLLGMLLVIPEPPPLARLIGCVQ